VVIVGAPPQDFFADGLDLVNVAEEVDDVLRTREQRQMAEDGDAVEAVTYQAQQTSIQLCEGLHRYKPLVFSEERRRGLHSLDVPSQFGTSNE